MEAFTDPQTIILFLASAATFLTVMAIGMPYLKRDNFSSRLKAVAKRREELSAQQRARAAEESKGKKSVIRESHVTTMKSILERLKMQNLMGSPALKIKMSQAGYRSQAHIVTFAFTRLALPFIFGIVCGFMVFVGDAVEATTNGKLMYTLGAAVAGYYFPNLILANLIQKRQKTLIQSFPDALDLMCICVEAGLSIEAAFSRVTEEMADGAPIVAEEFGLTTAELSFLGDRRMALENLATRTGAPSVKSLSTALIQAEKYGTPLGVALRVLSQESREERLSRAEEKAASLPAKLTVPMIAFFLPVIFFVVLGPAIIQAMNTFQN